MKTELRFCLWLIELLSREKLTLKEIKERWQYSSVCDVFVELSTSTFRRRCKMCIDLFGLEVICNKATNQYHIKEDNRDHLIEWLKSSMSIAGLSQKLRNSNIVVLENPPAGCDRLQEMLYCIEQKKHILVEYNSYYRGLEEFELIPVIIRLHKQRWYIVGISIVNQQVRTCALERIIRFEYLEDPEHRLTKRVLKDIDPTTYFDHCFGIIKSEDPLWITFRAFSPQNAYIRSLPLHDSQIEIERTNNYSDFKIYVRPTYDLQQELLWHRENLQILSPISFRNEMREIVKKMIDNYK